MSTVIAQLTIMQYVYDIYFITSYAAAYFVRRTLQCKAHKTNILNYAGMFNKNNGYKLIRYSKRTKFHLNDKKKGPI